MQCHQRMQRLEPSGVSLVVEVGEEELPAWVAQGLLAVLELVALGPVGLVLLEVGWLQLPILPLHLYRFRRNQHPHPPYRQHLQSTT